MLKQYLTKKLLGGALFGLGAVLIFGAYLWVQAQVAPGTVTNPTFGPQDQDVVMGGGAFPSYPIKACKRNNPEYTDYTIVGKDWTNCGPLTDTWTSASPCCMHADTFDCSAPAACGW